MAGDPQARDRERDHNTAREQAAVDAVLAALPALADQLRQIALPLVSSWAGHPVPSVPVARLEALLGIATMALNDCAQAARQPRGHYDTLLGRSYGDLYPLRGS